MKKLSLKSMYLLNILFMLMIVASFVSMLIGMSNDNREFALIFIISTFVFIILAVITSSKISKIENRVKEVKKKRQTIYFRQVIQHIIDGELDEAKNLIKKFNYTYDYLMFTSGLLIGSKLDKNYLKEVSETIIENQDKL